MASDNRLIFLEPNCPGREIPNTEDFSIFVELKSISKNRSTATEGSGLSNETGGKTIGFIDGTKIGGGRRSLTTNYTEIGTTFGKESDDLETLGIESIDITFDTAYTPVIKIKFIDIRGNSVLEKGTDSRYKMFFELPFPLFKLTVQGFYGKAVTYCLHLTKWNASFNSTSGNFEIDTEFIGYTYALLTDCLLGYMRATVLTDIGKNIFGNYLSMIDEKGDKKYPGLMTIEEFLKYITTINESFLKIKENNETIKQLNSLTLLTEQLDIIKTRIDTLKDTGIKNLIISLIESNKISLFDNDKYKLKSKEIAEKIKDYKKTQGEDIKAINENITVNDLKISPVILKVLETTATRNKLTDNFIVNNPDGVTYTEIKTITIENIIEKKYEESSLKLNIIDFTSCYEEIDRVKEKIRERKKKLDEELSELVKSKIETDFKFKPSIKNIVNIFCIHAQVFLETIEEVSKIAQAKESRGKILRNLTNETNKSKPVYPWLEYKKKDTDGSVFESWIGGDLTPNDYKEVTEVMFVEELLANLMKIARKDEIRELTGFGDTPIFLPVSPAEASISINGDTPSLVKSNPYAQALKTNTPQEAIRCLLFRIFTYAGVTNRNIGEKDSKFLGKIEAETLYTYINTEFDSIKKKSLLTSIADLASGGDKAGFDNVYSLWRDGGKIEGVEHPGDQDSPNLGKFFKQDPNNESNIFYTYITGSTGNNEVTSYIPINNGFDGKDFFIDGTGTTKTIPELKDLSKNLIFTSNYFNNSESVKEDDGSVYFRILLNDNRKDLYFTGKAPLVDSLSFTKYLDYVGTDSIIEEVRLESATYKNLDLANDEKLNRYNGLYKTLEIEDITFKKRSDIGETGKKGSVIKSYFYQKDSEKVINDTYIGPYLATNNKVDLNLLDKPATKNIYFTKQMFDPLRKLNYHYTDNGNEDFLVTYTSINTESSSIESEINTQPRSKLQFFFKPTKLGSSQKKMVANEYEKEDDEELYLPFVDYHISPQRSLENKEFLNSFSLFGSMFYYDQKKYDVDGDVGKAFLFLHSIPWEGVVGDIKDSDNDFDNASLFELFDIDDDGDNDGTQTIKGLYGNAGSFIKAPVLWCAFIGALLYRYDKFKTDDEDIINFTPSNTTDSNYMFPWQTEETYLPKHDEYLRYSDAQSSAGIYLVMSQEDNEVNDDGDPRYYGKVDKVVLDFPKQVRDEFKRIFLSFVKNDFADIQKEYELFKDVEDLKDKWKLLSKEVGVIEIDENKKFITNEFSTTMTTGSSSFPEDVFMIPNSESFDTYIKNVSTKRIVIKKEKIKNIIGTNEENTEGNKFTNVLKNYVNITPINDNLWSEREPEGAGGTSYKYTTPIGKNIYQFDLSLNSNDKNATKLVKPYLKTCHIMNATPRVFRPNYTILKESPQISVKATILEAAVISFFEHFIKLNKNNKKDDDRIQQRIFNNVDDDIIKLNIYRTLSSINDKWLGGKLDDSCANIKNIVNTFKFLDSGFINIGDDFLINPLGLQKKIISNYNQSFFTLINGLLLENNFNFIPLPSYIEFNNAEDMYDNIFTPIPFKSNISETSVKPAFICVYTGQKSSQLDLGKDSEHKDDGVFIAKEVNSGCGKQSQPAKEPEIFTTKRDETGAFIPYFLVSYGKGNQSIFKDIKLDQREFAETAESLEIIEDLSNDGDKNKVTYKGQNLFNVYQKRSYSAEVEVMGNATIQPMMYFQLNNIPMFKGAYLIYNTTHSITAHSMKTTFKGSRIKNIKTPLIDEVQLFKTLIGPISSVGPADKITDKNRTSKSSAAARLSKFIDTPVNVNILPVPTTVGNGTPKGLIKQKPAAGNKIYLYGIREVVETIQIIAKEMIVEEKRDIYYNDLSVKGGGDIDNHESHELGLDIDIRPIANEVGDFTIDISSAPKYYDKVKTKKLIKKLTDAVYLDADGKKTTQEAVKLIYFNDDDFIADFPKVRVLKGHTNHLHVSFNEPKRVTEDIGENTSDDPSQNVNSRSFNN